MTVSRPPGNAVPADCAEHCITLTQHRVRVGETDMMGVVHHSQYIGFLEVGRLEYLRRRGLSYRTLVERQIHLPVIGLNLKYHRPAYFDDLLEIETRLSRLGRVQVLFDYRVVRQEAAERLLLVDGQVTLACVDDKPRPRALPEDVIAAVLGPEKSHPPS